MAHAPHLIQIGASSFQATTFVFNVRNGTTAQRKINALIKNENLQVQNKTYTLCGTWRKIKGW